VTVTLYAVFETGPLFFDDHADVLRSPKF